MSRAQFEIAVAIPTRGRETRLAFALDGLASQTLARHAFQVVVVREERASGPYADAPAGLDVRFVTSSDPSPSAMRNRGWRAADAPVIAFMDDDCRPSERWLEHLLAAARNAAGEDGEFILQGRTEPDPNERHLLIGLARSIEVSGPGLYETCNIAYPRSLLERLGGFDESFGVPHWGEDTDLGLRAEAAGAGVRWVDEAVVWHAVHSRSLARAVRETSRRAGFAQLLARHPALRARLLMGLFVKDSHAAVTLATLGAVAGLSSGSRGRAIAAAATLPYLALNARSWVRPGKPTLRRLGRYGLHLPAATVLDLAETIATVHGAVRYRTPVV